PPPTTALFPYTTLFRSPKTAMVSLGLKKFSSGSRPRGNRTMRRLPVKAQASSRPYARRKLRNQPLRKRSTQEFWMLLTNSLLARSEEHTSELQSRFDLV